MKVQELLPSSKPSPASRDRRSAAPEANSSDFAGALTEARKKPESKPAESDAPAAKKPPVAKKGESANDEAAPAEDAVAPEASVPADQPEAPAAIEDDESVAGTDEPVEIDDAEAAGEPELPKVEANLSAITITQMVGPQALPTQDLSPSADAEATDGADQMISPPNFQWQQHIKPAEGDAEPAGIPLDLDELAGSEGSDEIPFALKDAEIDPALTPKAPAKRPAAPVAAVESGEQPEPQSTAKDGGDKQQLPRAASAFAQAADASEDAMGSAPAAAEGSSDATTTPTTPTAMHVQAEPAKAQATPAAPPAPAPLPPQAHFAEANHPKIVMAVQTHMLTNGGTMQIRLDPPELGALHVMVHMQDGVMTASFHTSNDDATRLLSHSLSQLKQVLESHGVSVEKLQVQQSPKDQPAGNQKEDGQPQRDAHDDAHRQEQQRKEMLRRMWRRLANGSDPLDLVA